MNGCFWKFIRQVYHCVKSDQIRSFFWSEYMKIRTRKNSVFGHFSRSVFVRVFRNFKKSWLNKLLLILIIKISWLEFSWQARYSKDLKIMAPILLNVFVGIINEALLILQRFHHDRNAMKFMPKVGQCLGP